MAPAHWKWPRREGTRGEQLEEREQQPGAAWRKKEARRSAADGKRGGPAPRTRCATLPQAARCLGAAALTELPKVVDAGAGPAEHQPLLGGACSTRRLRRTRASGSPHTRINAQGVRWMQPRRPEADGTGVERESQPPPPHGRGPHPLRHPCMLLLRQLGTVLPTQTASACIPGPASRHSSGRYPTPTASRCSLASHWQLRPQPADPPLAPLLLLLARKLRTSAPFGPNQRRGAHHERGDTHSAPWRRRPTAAASRRSSWSRR